MGAVPVCYENKGEMGAGILPTPEFLDAECWDGCWAVSAVGLGTARRPARAGRPSITDMAGIACVSSGDNYGFAASCSVSQDRIIFT